MRVDSTSRLDCRETSFEARLAAAVAVGMIEALDRGARHQECLQNPVIHGRDALPGNAFVVVGVPAIQVDSLRLAQSGIEDDTEKVRQHARAQALGEGLAFALIFLAVAFDAVSEDFVEEDAGGASGENGRAQKGFGYRGVQQSGQIGAHAVDGGQQHVVGRQRGGIGGVEARCRRQIHTVGGAAFGGNRDAHEVAAVLQTAAFGVDEVSGFPLRDQRHAGGEDFRKAVEFAR